MLNTVLSNTYFIVVIGIYITKKLQLTKWITVAAAALNFIFNFLLTPVYRAIGTPFSIMMANFMIFILTMLFSQKHNRIDFGFGNILIIFFPAALFVTLTYLLGLKIVPRINISSAFLKAVEIYLYNTFMNLNDFKKLIGKLKNILLNGEFKSSAPLSALSYFPISG